MKQAKAVVLPIVVMAFAVFAGMSPSYAQSCGDTSACRGAQATLEDMAAELKKVDPAAMSITHASMLQAVLMRVTVGCLKVCYEAEETARCKGELDGAIDQFQASYEQAIQAAEEASAGLWPGVEEFDRDPDNSEFVREKLPEYGVRVVGGIDSCGY